MEVYTLSADRELTVSMLQKYIDAHATEVARRKKLQAYYAGEHSEILSRSFDDAAKPNNKIVNPYPQYITDIMSSYFMGEPVTYTADDSKLLDEIIQIMTYNDEAAENAELATDASINGLAYELLYVDTDGMLRFKRLDPTYAIAIYDNTIEQELLYFIRYYDETDIETGKSTRYVEVYGRSDVKLYEQQSSSFTLMATKAHAFGIVPVCIYRNNAAAQGDFEAVMSLIDAYDRMQSNMVNDQDYFSDAYMTLSGAEGTDENQIAAMKINRVLILPQGVQAGWLTKADTTAAGESILTRLDAAIHKFSKCPAMTDQSFAGNSSGVALRYKLMGLEGAAAQKEREFKRGLQRRLELLCNVLGVMQRDYDWRAVNITFTRNIPVNLEEMADIVNKIGDLISKQARVALLPIDIDYEADKKLQDEEAQAGYADYPDADLLEQSGTAEL